MVFVFIFVALVVYCWCLLRGGWHLRVLYLLQVCCAFAGFGLVLIGWFNCLVGWDGCGCGLEVAHVDLVWFYWLCRLGVVWVRLVVAGCGAGLIVLLSFVNYDYLFVV